MYACMHVCMYVYDKRMYVSMYVYDKRNATDAADAISIIRRLAPDGECR
jgi:hypothetical protein